MKRALADEDDHSIVDLLSIHLNDLDCDVDKVYDCVEGQDKAIKNPYDLIILDIMLPGKDGISIAQKLQAFDVDKRIVLLSDKHIELTLKDFYLLVLLARNPSRSYGRGQLLSDVWGLVKSWHKYFIPYLTCSTKC